jgi:hypothetical protein
MAFFRFSLLSFFSIFAALFILSFSLKRGWEREEEREWVINVAESEESSSSRKRQRDLHC